ncbi:MAG: hypothetical protein GY913_07775 [Proteobacteria bacterium]|nr:hypothetical protein [Pseudomonadota bacterium]MCP4916810.1 hypothetical protein [Pseudomonadota bacterium]
MKTSNSSASEPEIVPTHREPRRSSIAIMMMAAMKTSSATTSESTAAVPRYSPTNAPIDSATAVAIPNAAVTPRQ